MDLTRSEFDSDQAESAWWATRVGSSVVVCSISGRGFLGLLQRTLGATESGAWDSDTLSALYAALVARKAPGSLVQSIEQDLQARTIGPGVLSAALWAIHRTARGPVPGTLSTEDIRLPAYVTVPAWGQRFEPAAREPIVCADLMNSQGMPVDWNETIDMTTIPGRSWWPPVLVGGLALTALVFAASQRRSG